MMRIPLAFLPLILALSFQPLIAQAQNLAEISKKMNVAHRGASAELPEETLAAFELAVLQGANYLECDMVGTMDNVLVCRHQSDLIDDTNVSVADVPKTENTYEMDDIYATPKKSIYTASMQHDQLVSLRARQRVETRPQEFNDKFPLATPKELLELIDRVNRWKAMVLHAQDIMMKEHEDAACWKRAGPNRLRALCCFLTCCDFLASSPLPDVDPTGGIAWAFFTGIQYGSRQVLDYLLPNVNEVKQFINNPYTVDVVEIPEGRKTIRREEVLQYFAPRNLYRYGLEGYKKLVAKFLLMRIEDVDEIIKHSKDISRFSGIPNFYWRRPLELAGQSNQSPGSASRIPPRLGPNNINAIQMESWMEQYSQPVSAIFEIKDLFFHYENHIFMIKLTEDLIRAHKDCLIKSIIIESFDSTSLQELRSKEPLIGIMQLTGMYSGEILSDRIYKDGVLKKIDNHKEVSCVECWVSPRPRNPRNIMPVQYDNSAYDDVVDGLSAERKTCLEHIKANGYLLDIDLDASDRTSAIRVVPACMERISSYASLVGPDKKYLIGNKAFIDSAKNYGVGVAPYTFAEDNARPLPSMSLSTEFDYYHKLGVIGVFTDNPLNYAELLQDLAWMETKKVCASGVSDVESPDKYAEQSQDDRMDAENACLSGVSDVAPQVGDAGVPVLRVVEG